MQKQIDHSMACALAVEANKAKVEECLQMLLMLVATGEQWETLWHLIKEQKRDGHETAVFFIPNGNNIWIISKAALEFLIHQTMETSHG